MIDDAPPADPADLLALAVDIAAEAGALVLRMRRAGVEVTATKSSPIDVVTRADRASEELIRRRIAEARPHDAFLGEESGAEGGDSGITWVVDPIDGTVNYLYDLATWSVSIAVVQGPPDPGAWTALAGVVEAPAMGERFTASAGSGAWLGERRLRVREPVPLDRALVSTGYHYTQAIRGNQARVNAALVTRVRDLRRTGGAAIDLCAVAAGRTDAFFEQGLNPWDIAAGGLVVTEAGGVITGLPGAAPSGRMVLAAEPRVAAELGVALVDLGA